MNNTIVPYNVLRNTEMSHISGTNWDKKQIINALDDMSTLEDIIYSGMNGDNNDMLLSVLKFTGITALEAIPVVGGTISKLISTLLFPSKIDYEDIWNNLKKSIDQLVDKKITEALMSQLMQELAGLAEVLKKYRDAYDLYNNNTFFHIPIEMTPGDYLIDVFNSADILFTQRIPMFQNKEYDIHFLPFFVHAAEMHIVLVRDAAIHGLEWGMDKVVHQHFKKLLKDLIQKYSKYVLDTYKKGLKEATERELVDSDFPTHYERAPYINTVRWNVINKYKRGMILTVLDFTYRWKYYHESYQKNLILNPNRTVYSDIDGAVYPYEKTTKEIDELVKNRTLVYRGNLKDIRISSFDRIDSIQTTYIRENQYIEGTKAGGSGGKEQLIHLKNPTGNPITTITTWSELVPSGVALHCYDGSDLGHYGHNRPSTKVTIYNHVGNKVSSIIGFGKNETGGFESLDAMVIGFKQDDYIPENNFVPVNQNIEPITKGIDVGKFYEEKFESNIKMVDEPMFGDEVLQFENYSNNLNQCSYVTYRIHTEIEGTYELHAIIGAKKQKDKIAFKMALNEQQPENFITDSFDDGDIWDGMSLSEGLVYKRILVGRFQLKKGMNHISIHNGALQTSANIKTWNLAALELTITSDSLIDPDITTLYDKDNYDGSKKFIFENTSRLTDFDDKTSSVKVGSNVSGLRLYEQYEYGGEFIDLVGGEKISLKNNGFNNRASSVNNRASSVKFSNIALYNQDNYEGSRKLIFEDVPELTDFNDQTSSIVVSNNVTGARLYEHANYKGRYLDVVGGEKCSLKNHVLNKKISSIQFFKEDELLNGEYQIVTAVNNKSVIEKPLEGITVQLWDNIGNENQKWRVEYDRTKKAYLIENIRDKGSVLTNFGSVIVYCIPYDGSLDQYQYWTFEYVGNDYYIIRSKANSDLVLDVHNADPTNGNIIKLNQQHDLNSPNINAQKFKFNDVNN
ncbi:insecticidal delta-endotoxin Cry8Ea1 family protein [Bacillus wiedmannii]|uniref:insecticidal delta-endotoxin Cry8Ea1 family protein n=1 Tax=Bacillus wiedmannii TaxID=1890302 RepID=UPI003CEE9814